MNGNKEKKPIIRTVKRKTMRLNRKVGEHL